MIVSILNVVSLLFFIFKDTERNMMESDMQWILVVLLMAVLFIY